ncbi:MAG: hypothetical protein V4555_18315, partial [Acidobacteriota bacterium]
MKTDTFIPACIIARASARPPVTPIAARTVAALPAPSENRPHDEAITDTIDYGPYPVGAECHPERSEGSAVQNAPLDLPPVEDTESIQLALIDVLQALAANQLDTKRAGLLLYGLQVASANAAKM